jgi:hypothetical protein
VAAKVEIMRREANRAKAREGLRYEEGVSELNKARLMKDPNYVRLAKVRKIFFKNFVFLLNQSINDK